MKTTFFSKQYLHSNSVTKMNIYNFIIIIFIIFLYGCDQESNINVSQYSSIMEAKIDSIGDRFIEQGKVVGISIAVMKGQDTLYNNSFGFVDSLRIMPAKNDDIFLMASISKLVGATMVMKLVEEGILNLEDKLIDLLPDFPNSDQAKQIKLRHLISMTSGLKEYAPTIDSIYFSSGVHPTKEDFFDFFNSHGLDFEPGSFYKYSNSGFLLMSMIIEKATNSSFESQIEKIINEPTGLNFKLISERLKDSEMTDYFELTDSFIIYRPHLPWIKGD